MINEHLTRIVCNLALASSWNTQLQMQLSMAPDPRAPQWVYAGVEHLCVASAEVV